MITLSVRLALGLALVLWLTKRICHFRTGVDNVNAVGSKSVFALC